ncbi:hypothetical protein MUK70_11970 [Dyadobacter chenwenxiniae]|uniref:Terminase small subunit n=1 Tax=Dyadobacter chenwenxiniae TaxID=2906456 RepID=A0A9X1PH85_9BACT|nr:hypothetical protein [Dyadobacter chenwenxiniae]MCF0059959.1 hypothetical protein [Dyadobacter chenwenxiniae]UON85698.1 hypothetical protein MUK70_11970 [Dyadobacter chenwenxiniae]
MLGFTDRELAAFFEVQGSTLNNWKVDHPEFLEAVHAGKHIADAEVAASFYKKATGYRYEEVTYEKIIIKDGEGFLTEGDADDDGITVDPFKKKVVVREIAPDAGAALNWLKNRQPKKWRDKQEIDHTSAGEKISPTVIVFKDGNGSSSE